jgi:hypothetical protein
VNDHGFQTHEDPGRWFNLSRYVTPAPIIPPRGTAVRLTIDGSGFVRAIEPLSLQGEAPVVPHETRQEAVGAAQHPSPTREVVISRLAVLKAAAAFCAARPDLKSSDVLRVAESWEAWITR